MMTTNLLLFTRSTNALPRSWSSTLGETSRHKTSQADFPCSWDERTAEEASGPTIVTVVILQAGVNACMDLDEHWWANLTANNPRCLITHHFLPDDIRLPYLHTRHVEIAADGQTEAP